jgi:hydrophobe/amphiphile efflux-1 (HAE1) family protein
MSVEVKDLPSLSIRRPVLVLVLNLLVALAGIAAIMAVEVRELPDVDRPVVTVFTSYPGASPETVDNEVTSLIEGAVARVSGVMNIRSASEENSSRVSLEFLPGINLDNAASDVREAVSRVERRLPNRIEQVLVIKADSNSESIINIAVYSETLLGEELSRLINQDIIPQLISVDGVADVSVFGARKRLLRILLDPLRMASLGLSVSDITRTLRTAPFDVPAGSFRTGTQELLVRADATVVTEQQVADIIVNGNTRIGDVATVYFGPETPGRYTRLDGKNVISLGIVRKAKSNTIQISNGVREAVANINDRFDNLEIIITNDDADFIRSSVREVLFTLSMTILIVISTIWLFMRSLRATLIPSVAIPIALTGTVAGIWLFGFSINILTLLALVLATGLVVDDAIVVLENIQRRRGQDLGGRAAAVVGTRQVFFAVVTTTAVLVSVFIPIAFLPGTAGRLFREFGLVLAIAVAISSFVSLSLVPAMASRLPEGGREGLVSSWLARCGIRIRELYSRTLRVALNHPYIFIIITICLGLAAFTTYQTLNKELLPREDRGLFRVHISGPEGVGISYMDRQTRQAEQILQPLLDSGEISSLFTVVGTYDPNQSRITAPLADWSQRTRGQQEIMRSLELPMSEITGAEVSISGSNSLSVRGGSSNRINVALTGNEYDQIYDAARIFARAIEDGSTNLSRPDISYKPTQPQLLLDIDRRRAIDLGINLDSLAETLRVMVNGDEILDLNVQDEAVPVFLEASTGAINDPGDLVNLYVSTSAGTLLPISSIVTFREEAIAAELNRHAQRRAIEITANLRAGYPLQSAVNELRMIADEVLPDNISMILLGDAATLEQTSHDVALTYVIAFLVVFLVLCAQFEGFTSAVVVILLVPFGIAAAIFALFITGTSLNIYSQIGLVMLIGLMAKNGVLVVEFADQLRDRGYEIRKAIETGSSIRLRPVSMTMMCTVLGGLPLILGSGAGAEARSSIGWVVFGGLGLAALFTLYLTPVLYLLFARFSTARAMESLRLKDELKQANLLQEDH